MSDSRLQSESLKKLKEAENLMNEELANIGTLNNEIESKKSDIEKEKEAKKNEIETLHRQIEELNKEVEHIHKLTSASRDARKMYGDMTPGDTTHQDVTLAYANHFKTAHRQMPKKLNKEGNDKYIIWQECSNAVERCFETTRESLVETMAKKLKDSLKKSDHETVISEETYDLQRGFKMLIDDMSEKNELNPIIDEVKNDNPKLKDEVDFVVEMMKTLKADDYLHFIKEGELKNRPAINIELSS